MNLKQQYLNALTNLHNASQRAQMNWQEHTLCLKSQDLLAQFIERAFPEPQEKDAKGESIQQPS